MQYFQPQENALVAHFTFADFVEAMAFINKVAVLAEEQQHHPTISNTYNRVSLLLTTHDAGNTITNKDEQLAQAIEQLL
ncbi:MAG: 4a-hydroxytetrahydrobiopterin dehydratase [Bacteroidetes bacterium]|nr:MAG: 4a-hydroxytetrahydrobiopterin dehydratase [Bacteroidota bacterium]TAF98391.1 MAG: 4a-hydroxytetrahydrobiopterin dehydratase [Bacteroidota bacterium]